MPLEERRARHAAMLEEVETHDIRWWIGTYLDALENESTGGIARL
jgi:trehalose 6-phosphate synthase